MIPSHPPAGRQTLAEGAAGAQFRVLREARVKNKVLFINILQVHIVTPRGSVLKKRGGLGSAGSPKPDKLTLNYQMEGYIE